MASKSPRATGGSQNQVAGYDVASLSRLSPEQQSLASRLFSGSAGGIESGLQNTSRLAAGDESYFQQLEAPALRQFGQLQGKIASRFSGQGMGGRRSSAFQNEQNSAAAELSERLQSQRMGLQRQATQDLLGVSDTLLNRDMTQNFLTEPKKKKKKKSFWSKFTSAALPIAGGVAGALLGGPAGAGVGFSAGGAASKAFFD
jgi:hypothetical protein